MNDVDVVIIGAGVVGLALAWECTQRGHTVLLCEKNDSWGQETSSRNSEVIHAGMYYPPGSLKARLCVEGNRLLYAFCTAYGVPHRRVGKVIVARNHNEGAVIERLYHTGTANGATGLSLIDQRALAAREPNVTGVAALLSNDTGILDTHRCMHALWRLAKNNGADMLCRTEVRGVRRTGSGLATETIDGQGECATVRSAVVINAAGLHADDIARAAGIDIDQAGYRLQYCKGEYFRLRSVASGLVNGLVYPVPDHVSLGVHLTCDLAGGIRLGPSAFYIDRTRADYRVDERNRALFAASAQRLVPSLHDDEVIPDTAGIRPKLQGPHDDFRDFVIGHEAARGLAGLINLIGIESPGFTASLAIARMVTNMVDEIV